jgi:hypothetical protein
VDSGREALILTRNYFNASLAVLQHLIVMFVFKGFSRACPFRMSGEGL